MFQTYFDAIDEALKKVTVDKDDQIKITNQNFFNLDEEFKDVEILKVNNVFRFFKNGVQLNINVDDRSIYWKYWISRDFKEFLGNDFNFDRYTGRRIIYDSLYTMYKNYFDEYFNDLEEVRDIVIEHNFSVKNITTKAYFGNDYENPFETKITSCIDFISIIYPRFPINDSFIEVLLFNDILVDERKNDLDNLEHILIDWLVVVWPKLLKKRTLFNHPGLQEKIEIYNRSFYNHVLKFKEFKKAYDEEDDVYFEREYGGSYEATEQEFRDNYYEAEISDYTYDGDRGIYIVENDEEVDEEDIWSYIMEDFDFFEELYKMSFELTAGAKYVVQHYPNF